MSKNYFFIDKSYDFQDEVDIYSFAEIMKKDYQSFFMKDGIALNATQEAMHIFNQRNKGNKVYFISFYADVLTDIDKDFMLENVKKIIYANQLNVIGIKENRNKFYFRLGNIDENIDLVYQEQDDNKTKEDYIDSLYSKYLNQLSASSSEFFKIILVMLNTGSYVILFLFSHIIFSGTSVDSLIKKVFSNDDNAENGLAGHVTGCELTNEKIEKLMHKVYDGNYDKVMFHNGIVHNNRYECISQVITVKDGLFTGLKAYLQEQRIDVYSFITAAYSSAIFQYTGQDNFCLGFPVDNSQGRRLGCDIKILPLPINIGKDEDILQLAKKIRKKRLNLLGLKDMGADNIFDRLQEQGRSNEKLEINIAISYQKIVTVPEEETTYRLHLLKEKELEYDLSLEIIEYNNSIDLILKNNVNFMQEHVFTTCKDTLEYKIADALNGNSSPIRRYRSIEDEELYEWNEKETYYIHKEFEKRVRENSDDIAVIYQEREVTYKEFNAFINRIANYLLDIGLKQDQIVVVCSKNSYMAVALFYAIMKAGAVYLPVDFKCPEKRVNEILQYSEAVIIIGDEQNIGSLSDNKIQKIDVNILEKVSCKYSDLLENSICNRRAYVIFTSGTSGKPKGVVNTHKGVCELVHSAVKMYRIAPGDRCMLLHSTAFDFSIWEMLISTLSGGTLVILCDDKLEDINEYVRVALEKKVTLVNLTPSVFSEFDYIMRKNEQNLDNCIRIMFLGAENLNMNMLEGWMKEYPMCKMVNLYGPSETSIIATIYDIEPIETDEVRANRYSCIGKAINSAQVIILDKDNNIVPNGCTGEICISGPCVGDGYLKDLPLTEKHFVRLKNGTVLYKTSDYGFEDDKHRIHYVGRNGSYIKIRGFRVDLREIGNYINSVNEVADSCVLAVENGDSTCIIAYIVAKEQNSDKKLISNIQEYLYSKLPHYMIPKRIEVVSMLPRTISGKVDTCRLKEMYILSLNHKEVYIPKDEIEEKVLKAASEALGIDMVNIEDDFFYLGGDSIKVIRFINSLGYELSISDVFQHTIFRSLCDWIRENNSVKRIKKDEEQIYLSELLFIKAEYDEKRLRRSLSLCAIIHRDLIGLLDNIKVVEYETDNFTGELRELVKDMDRAALVVGIFRKEKGFDIMLSTSGKVGKGLQKYCGDLIGCYKEMLDWYMNKTINNVKITEKLLKKLPKNFEDILPLSCMQKSMVYDFVMGTDETLYNCVTPYAFRDKAFSWELFHEAIRIMVQKHDVFRTMFIDYFVCQIINTESESRIMFENLAGLSETEQIGFISQKVKESRITKRDIRKGILYRMKLFQCSEDYFQFVLIFHHAILDGMSVALFFDECFRIYDQLKRNICHSAGKLKNSIGDIIMEEQQIIRDERYISFWKKELSKNKYKSILMQKAGQITSSIEKYSFVGEEFKKINSYIRNARVSSFVFFAAEILYVMSRRQKPSSIGVVQHLRKYHNDSDKILGNFLNIVPFCIDSPDRDFDSYLHVVMEKYKYLLEFSSMPLMVLKQFRDIESSKPLYDVCFNYTDFVKQYQENETVTWEKSLIPPSGTISAAINFNVTKYVDAYVITYEMNVNESEQKSLVSLFNEILELIQVHIK